MHSLHHSRCIPLIRLEHLISWNTAPASHCTQNQEKMNKHLTMAKSSTWWSLASPAAWLHATFSLLSAPALQSCFQALCLWCATHWALDWGCDPLLITCLSTISHFSLARGILIFFFRYGTVIMSRRKGPSTWTMIVPSQSWEMIPFSFISDWFRWSMWSTFDQCDLRGSLFGDFGKDFSSWDEEKKNGRSPLLPVFECKWKCDSHPVTMWRKPRGQEDCGKADPELWCPWAAALASLGPTYQ